jgi:hypothetical protein
LCPSINASEFVHELTSPVTTQARAPFLTGAGITLVSILLEDQIEDPTQKETTEERPLGKYSKFGDLMGHLVPNGLYILGMGLDGYFRDQEQYKKSLLMLKATAYASSLTTLLKYSVREKRPNGNGRNSFPSGHSTTAFAFASVIGSVHGVWWGMGAYSLAGLVAYSRMNDNAHYLHDILAGATIGLGYGLGLSALFKENASPVSFYILPVEKEGLQMIATYNF